MYTSISERDDQHFDSEEHGHEEHGHEERYCPYCYGGQLERLGHPRHFKCRSCGVVWVRSVLALSENCDDWWT